MIDKLAKKLKISEEVVTAILAEQKLYDSHYKNLQNIEFDTSDHVSKFIKNITKKLKVEESAVVSYILKNYLKHTEGE